MLSVLRKTVGLKATPKVPSCTVLIQRYSNTQTVSEKPAQNKRAKAFESISGNYTLRTSYSSIILTITQFILFVFCYRDIIHIKMTYCKGRTILM